MGPIFFVISAAGVSPVAIVAMIRIIKIVPGTRASSKYPIRGRVSSSQTGKLSTFPMVAVCFGFKFGLYTDYIDSAVSQIFPRLRVEDDGSFSYGVPGSPY